MPAADDEFLDAARHASVSPSNTPQGMTTLNDLWAGDGSRLPTGSLARTSNAWRPAGRRPYCFGDTQRTQRLPSSRHRKVDPASFDRNANRGVLVVVFPVGPAVMVVRGVAVSTLKDRRAGVGSVFAAWSVALTSNVCGPSVRVAALKGEVHAANVSSSMRHSNVASGSVDVKVKEGAFLLVGPEGPSAIVVSGGVVSGGDAVVLAAQLTVPHGA